MHKGKNIFGALSIRTGHVIDYICDRKDGKSACRFMDKVKEFKDRVYGAECRALLLWDNASCHKSGQMREWLRQNPNHVELDNFPPYSPEMNPIEHVWKEVKKHINALRGEAPLVEIVQEAADFLKDNTFYYKLLGLDRFRIFK